jgi:alkylated DNA repair dioxygenase AlkB
MEDLFSNTSSEVIHFKLPDADILYVSRFFSEMEADNLFQKLLHETPWQQDRIKVYGKEFAQPRLTCLYGNEGKCYQYSNIKMQPHPWNATLLYLKEKVEMFSKHEFTTVLMNLYRDGKDSNGWHADNEKELGKNPVIASLSLGAKRDFHLKHDELKNEKIKITLEHGSLLVMQGTTQHFWKHQIPKTLKPISPRINLTFRTIV